jgi:hypothetical protein
MTTTEKLTTAQRTAKRLAELEAKVKQTRALVQKQNNALRHREQAAARKIQTRKKILMGAHLLEKHPTYAQSAEFTSWLTRDDERALFGLPPLTAKDAA